MAVRCPYCGNDTEYLSARQVAKLLGYAESTIRTNLIKGYYPGAKKVPGMHTSGMWRIPVTAILPLIKDDDE